MPSNDAVAVMVGSIIIYGFFFVLMAGLYALFYAMGRLFEVPRLVRFSYLFGLAQAFFAYAMIRTGYLDMFWVYLIASSAVAYMILPQLMWWLVVTFHRVFEIDHAEREVFHGH